ncbi:MAG: MCP four helix bundle domain-containing protein [Tenuifilaceae bacterium]|jgi:nitrate/nitrite-specific signal transduction histidine kinase|nr:MCP four helix bundle domain-containing protein [Tenuifilaceae bacterium]
MKKSLKLKILAGFMLLIALLTVAGAVSVVEFLKLSRSVNALIEDNYKTIEVTRTMLESLERTDSGVLLYLLGEKEEGRKIIASASATFDQALDAATNNITEANEDSYISIISDKYEQFSIKLNKTLSNNYHGGAMGWYHGEIYQSFLNVKHAVDELMSLNQSSMYEEATILKEKSHRAIMPGIVAIVGALVFSLLLSFFISKYYITPLSSLSDAIKTFTPRESQLRSNIKSEDEIKKIEVEVNNLITRLVKFHDEQKK